MKERIHGHDRHTSSPNSKKREWLSATWFIVLVIAVLSDISSCSSQLRHGWKRQENSSKSKKQQQQEQQHWVVQQSKSQQNASNSNAAANSSYTSTLAATSDMIPAASPNPIQQWLQANNRSNKGRTAQEDSEEQQPDVCTVADDEDLSQNESCEPPSLFDVLHEALQDYLDALLQVLHTLWFRLDRPIFMVVLNLCCILEAFRRAYQARRMALDMEALDTLEQKLARLYTVTKRSTTFFRQSFHQTTEEEDLQADELDFLATQSFVRAWTPVLSHLVGWLILMPWPALIFGYGISLSILDAKDTSSSLETQLYYSCQDDPSFAHTWILQSTKGLQEGFAYVSDQVMTFVWDLAIPKFWHPILLVQRLRMLSRWIRYIRYAGPLLRLCLKLQDQFWVFTKTWRQQWTAKSQKAKTIAHRSILFKDLQNLEQVVKESFPPTPTADSQLSLFSKSTAAVSEAISSRSTSFARLWHRKRQDSERYQRKLQKLKNELSHGSQVFPAAEIYDRMVEVTQEMTTQVKSAFWNAHLISPQTRFSLCWRLLVTIALLCELGRLLLSWQVSKTFDLRYRDLTIQLLGLCQQSSKPIRHWLGTVLRLPETHPWLDTCNTSSWSSQVNLQVASVTAAAIDIIGFLDIWVWFSTGELDENGVVVPKPFISRCIIPGTLLQVLDHPTVPQAIPQLFSAIQHAAEAVGYARTIRWILCLSPAIHYFVVDPLYQYLFRPMDKEEYYKESMQLFPSHHSMHQSHPSSSSRRDWSSSTAEMRLQKVGLSTAMLLDRLPESPASTYSTEDEYSDPSQQQPGLVQQESFLPRGFGSNSDLFHASIAESEGYGLYY